jgi:hypothetical protein
MADDDRVADAVEVDSGSADDEDVERAVELELELLELPELD